MKVHVLYEKDDGIWRIVRKKVKGNEIVLSRKRRVVTNEKYRHGYRNLGTISDSDYAEIRSANAKKHFRLLSLPHMEKTEETVPIGDFIQDEEDCRPITFLYKSMLGRMTGLPLWRIGPLYKATYKSHKIQPFGKNTLVPVDPTLLSAIASDNAVSQALHPNKGAMLLGFVLGAAMFFMVGYILGPALDAQLNPPAQVSNTTVRVVKGAILLWILPNVRMLLKGRRPQTPSVK